MFVKYQTSIHSEASNLDHFRPEDINQKSDQELLALQKQLEKLEEMAKKIRRPSNRRNSIYKVRLKSFEVENEKRTQLKVQTKSQTLIKGSRSSSSKTELKYELSGSSSEEDIFSETGQFSSDESVNLVCQKDLICHL